MAKRKNYVNEFPVACGADPDAFAILYVYIHTYVYVYVFVR